MFGVLFVAVGILFLGASIFHRRWFLSRTMAPKWAEFLGWRTARVICGVLGLAAIAAGLFVPGCAQSRDRPMDIVDAEPCDTIAALSRATRDRDFATYVDLHTEEFFKEPAAWWRHSHEELLRNPEKLCQLAVHLDMSKTEVRRMTWRDAMATTFRLSLKKDPDWMACLEHLEVIGEQTDGDRSRVSVQYGEPLSGEKHELLLIRRDARWLIHEWN